MKQSKFLFDRPVTKDWLFWIFIVLVFLNAIDAFQRVTQSGGVTTSTFSLASGTIDALFVLVSAFIWVLPIYLIRKLIRKSRKKNQSEQE